jgi:hypothetical protein
VEKVVMSVDQRCGRAAADGFADKAVAKSSAAAPPMKPRRDK